MVKNPFANAGEERDSGSTPPSGRPSGEGNGYPLQSSCLKNSLDGGAWQAVVPKVGKSGTYLVRE